MFSFFYDNVEEDPLRIVLPACFLWIVGSVVFWRARRVYAMSPRDKDADQYFSHQNSEPPHYVPFNAAVYALENVLPVVKLGQDDTWGPNPRVRTTRRHGWTRWLPEMSYNWLAFWRRFLIIVGWIFALILAGAIGDRFKR